MFSGKKFQEILEKSKEKQRYQEVKEESDEQENPPFTSTERSKSEKQDSNASAHLSFNGDQLEYNIFSNELLNKSHTPMMDLTDESCMQPERNFEELKTLSERPSVLITV